MPQWISCVGSAYNMNMEAVTINKIVGNLKDRDPVLQLSDITVESGRDATDQPSVWVYIDAKNFDRVDRPTRARLRRLVYDAFARGDIFEDTYVYVRFVNFTIEGEKP